MPKKVLDSDAFVELSNSAKIVLLISLGELDYWNKKQHKGQHKRDSTIGPLRNQGRFSLPNNMLKERGIKGSDTIAKARRELVAAGFWDVEETGSLHGSAILKWSDRWVTYNQMSYHDRKQLDNEAKPPGKCLYPNIIRHNEARRAAKADSANSKASFAQDTPEDFIAPGAENDALVLQ